jgi:hypothetical protein
VSYFKTLTNGILSDVSSVSVLETEATLEIQDLKRGEISGDRCSEGAVEVTAPES